jgi:hypothetical protein
MLIGKSSFDRYKNDASFKTLVDMMLYHIRDAKYTPTEIREAAMLAQIIFEETTLRQIFIDHIRSE